MKILIDADASPVVKIVENIAKEYSVPCELYCAIHWEQLDIVYPTRDKKEILRRINMISKWKNEYGRELL